MKLNFVAGLGSGIDGYRALMQHAVARITSSFGFPGSLWHVADVPLECLPNFSRFSLVSKHWSYLTAETSIWLGGFRTNADGTVTHPSGHLFAQEHTDIKTAQH